MPKEVVVVPAVQEEALLSCIGDLGFFVGKSAPRGRSGWTAAGERRVFLEMESILPAMERLRAGLRLWKSDRDDLLLVRDPEKKTIRVCLDGYSAEAANEILEGMKRHDIVFEIDHE
jgi:hypothetical protein